MSIQQRTEREREKGKVNYSIINIRGKEMGTSLTSNLMDCNGRVVAAPVIATLREKQTTTTTEKWRATATAIHIYNIAAPNISIYRIGSIFCAPCIRSFHIFFFVHVAYFWGFFFLPWVEVLFDSTASPSSNHARNATWLGDMSFSVQPHTQQDPGVGAGGRIEKKAKNVEIIVKGI